jgi:hypothetical protein
VSDLPKSVRERTGQSVSSKVAGTNGLDTGVTVKGSVPRDQRVSERRPQRQRPGGGAGRRPDGGLLSARIEHAQCPGRRDGTRVSSAYGTGLRNSVRWENQNGLCAHGRLCSQRALTRPRDTSVPVISADCRACGLAKTHATGQRNKVERAALQPRIRSGAGHNNVA